MSFEYLDPDPYQCEISLKKYLCPGDGSHSRVAETFLKIAHDTSRRYANFEGSMLIVHLEDLVVSKLRLKTTFNLKWQLIEPN